MNHTMTLSHIHIGYTSSEQPMQAPNSSVHFTVLFGYAQTALNADAMFEFRPHKCDKGLLPTILLWKQTFLKIVGLLHDD